MQFSYISIIYFVIFSILYKKRIEVQCYPEQNDDFNAAAMNIPEQDMQMIDDSPATANDEDDDIIRERRKAIVNLLRHFKEDMNKEESHADSDYAKRSLEWNKQTDNSNNWNSWGDASMNKETDDLDDLNEEANFMSFGESCAHKTENRNENNNKNANKGGAYRDRNQQSEYFARTSNKEARKQKSPYKWYQNFQKREDQQPYIHSMTNENARKNAIENSVQYDNVNAAFKDFENDNMEMSAQPRQLCCLCGQCSTYDKDSKNLLFQPYMDSSGNYMQAKENDYANKEKPAAPIDLDKFHMVGNKLNLLNQFEPHHDMENTRNMKLPLYRDYPQMKAAFLGNNKNKLSHEADYKLSKQEQDTAERLKNFQWLWPYLNLQKRSNAMHFNPMDEIKLKTSRRLMQRGYGPILPSNIQRDSHHETEIDKMLQRNEMELQRLKANNQELENKSDLIEKPQGDTEVEEELKDNTQTNVKEWNNVRQKRISEKEYNHEGDREKYYDDHHRFKRELEEKRTNKEMKKNMHEREMQEKPLSKKMRKNAHKREAQQKPFNRELKKPSNEFSTTNTLQLRSHYSLNEQHSQFSARRIKRSLLTNPFKENSSFTHTQRKRKKRNIASLNDIFADYDELEDNFPDLMDNDLENLNKIEDLYKTDQEYKRDLNKNLYNKPQYEKPKETNVNKQRRHQNHLSKTANMDSHKNDFKNLGKNHKYHDLSDNYIKLLNKIESEIENNEVRNKKLAKPTYREPLKSKNLERFKGKSAINEQNKNYIPYHTNRNDYKPKDLNMRNHGNHKKYPEYNHNNWADKSYGNYRNLNYRSLYKQDENNNTEPPTQPAAPKTTNQSNIFLRLDTEVKNCTGYDSLKEFLEAFAKNVTENQCKTPKTINLAPEEIGMHFTTEVIKEDTTTMMTTTTETSLLSTTQEPITEENWLEPEKSSEPTNSPNDLMENPTEECIDCTESETTTVSTTEIADYQDGGEFDNTSWSENPEEVTSTTESLPLTTMSMGSEKAQLSPTNEEVKLNIKINANLRGNMKDKNFNGTGTIHVKPGLNDERHLRDAKRHKKSPGAEKRASSLNYQDTNHFDDLSSGKVSSGLVKNIFDEVQTNPDLRILWPSLKRYQLSDQSSEPYLYNLQNIGNEDQIEYSHELMAKTVDAINNIIDQQMRSRACVALRPDLQEFYDLILKSQMHINARPHNKHERGNLKEQQQYKTLEEQSLDIKKLLQQYSALSEKQKQAVRPVHDVLMSQLRNTQSLQERLESQTNYVKEKRHLKDKRLNYNENYEKNYSPRYMQLQKASAVYHSLANEPNDGMP